MGNDLLDWRDCKLGDVLELKRGYDLPQQRRLPGAVPIVSSSGPSGFHSEAMVQAPGVVTGRYGTLGEVFFVERDFWPLNTTLYVRDFKGSDPKFISYFLKTIDFYSCSDKGAVPGVNRNHLHELPVRVPPLPTQRAIAHILGTLDDKIELNRKMNETLEAMARALFKSWFVDFDPVRAKSEGRKPTGMDDETAKLFPSNFVESELGRIPKGWSVTSLQALTAYLSRGVGPAYTEAGGVIVLNQKCIRDHRVDFTKSRRHDITKKSIEGRLLQELDVLVNSTGVGTLGRVAQLWSLEENAIVDSHVTVLRAANDVDPWFFGLCLLDREAEIEALGEGSTGQTELSRMRLGALLFIRPPEELQLRFGAAMSPHLHRIATNDRGNHKLALLRDELVPRLLSGELSVDAAEHVVGAVP